MYISKVNALNFTGGKVRITTKPNCQMETFETKDLEHIRSAKLNNNDIYVGCIFETGGKKYITDNNVAHWDYKQAIKEAEETDKTVDLPGLFTVE